MVGYLSSCLFLTKELIAATTKKQKRSSTTDPGIILHSLESSHMVDHNVVKEKTFSGTIWDTPEVLKQERNNMENEDGTCL